MEKHKEEEEFVSANQIHCALVAYPDCPFQCHSNEDLLKHIESAHKKESAKIAVRHLKQMMVWINTEGNPILHLSLYPEASLKTAGRISQN